MSRLRWSAAVLATALFASLTTAGPASAADPPVLTSLSVSTTTVTAPGTVTVSYAVTSDSPVTTAVANFLDPRNVLHSAHMTAGPTGSGTVKVDQWAETGTWRMVATTVTTQDGSKVRVCSAQWARTAVDCLEVRDLSAYDLTVTGATPEYDAPLLSAVTVAPATVRPGEPVTVAWQLRSAAPDLAAVQAIFADSGGNEVFQAFADPLRTGATSVYTTVPQGTADGTYSLAKLRLCDHVGNCAEYHPDGTVTLSGGARTPTGVQPRFAATVRISDDTVSPVLTSLAVSPVLVLGQPATAEYAVTDQQDILEYVRLTYRRDGDVNDVVLKRESAPGTGRISAAWAALGIYRLQQVEVDDGFSNSVRYQRDGAIVDQRFNLVVGRHAFDFSTLDLRILPKAPKVTSQTWPGGVRVSRVVSSGQFENPAFVPLALVAEPGHHTAVISGDNVDVGVIKGLTPGVTYTVSVTAQGPAGSSAATRFTTTPLLTSSVFGMGDLGKDGHADLVGRQSQARGGDVLGYRGNGRGGFTGSAFNTGTIVPGRLAFNGGDLNGDGFPDLVNDDNGTLKWRRGDGRDSFITEDIPMGGGWGAMRFITGGGDFSGDGRADVVGVARTGELYLYRGNGRGGLVSKTKINAGWGSMAAVFSPGDFDGDRTRDLLAVDRSGVLWLYPGNGKGGLRGVRSKVGAGWLSLGWAGPLEDFTGDGRADLGGVGVDGTLYVYPGNGRGGIRARTSLGAGWSRFF